MKQIILSTAMILIAFVACSQNNAGIKILPATTKKVTVPSSTEDAQLSFMNVFVVPDRDLVVVQWKNLNTENREIILADASGLTVQKSILYAGSTIVFFDTQTLYKGDYEVRVMDGNNRFGKKIQIIK